MLTRNYNEETKTGMSNIDYLHNVSNIKRCKDIKIIDNLHNFDNKKNH